MQLRLRMPHWTRKRIEGRRRIWTGGSPPSLQFFYPLHLWFFEFSQRSIKSGNTSRERASSCFWIWSSVSLAFWQTEIEGH